MTVDYVTVWDGRGSLYALTHAPGDERFWQTRGCITDHAPGGQLPTCAELRTQTMDSERTRSARADRLAVRRAAAKAKVNCTKCLRRPICARCRSLCRVCADKIAARARANR